MKHKGFVALDFEHLYPAHETACEVGAVRVVDGFVTGRYYSTILPHADYCQGRSNRDIIGLTDEMLATAPTFPEVFAQLRAFCGDLPLVAHHAATELAVLNKCCTLYGITDMLGNGEVFDTYDHTRCGLTDCCREHGIDLPDHHDPLQDATATARLFLALTGNREVVPVRGERKKAGLSKYAKEHEAFDRTILDPLSDDEVENKETPFFGGVRTVVTGQFRHFPDRNALKASLKALGADVNTSVSSRTQILVAGQSDVGPTKLQKATDLGIRIMHEGELLQYVTPQKATATE